MNLPTQVKIVEVGPRDGLQNEKEAVSAAVSITACVLRGVDTPMVSAMSISSQPRSRMRRTTSATASSGTSPW